MTRRLSLFALLPLALAACVRDPVTGKRSFSLLSTKDEIALGQQAAAEIKQTMGEYPDAKIQAYVSEVGMKMAKASERPELPWSFTVIDDPTVNAFALPGGPIFVTRGILTHLNSEAELASVLGHEIGHVTARHSAEQVSKAQLAQLGLGIGMIVKPELAGLGQAAAAGLQLMFLKYGRDAEKESDQLGFKYMLAQGYDPRQMDDVFATLGRASAAAGGGKIPEWASTHPNPENRERVAAERAEKVDPQQLAKTRVERDRYLASVGGMVFGDDPRQGFFKGNTFLHPTLDFQLQFPDGWKTQNTAAAVVAVSQKEDAIVQLTAAGKMSPEDATKKFFSQEGVKPAQVQSGSIGGLPATASYFEAQTQQGALRGLVSFVSHGGVTFMTLGYTSAQALPAYDPAFRQVLGSFGPLKDQSARGVQPARVELVRVDRDMSVADFNAQHPSTVPVELVAMINGLDAKGTFKAGTQAKRVTGGVPPQK
jgi:predicted Zn-dependent protease